MPQYKPLNRLVLAAFTGLSDGPAGGGPDRETTPLNATESGDRVLTMAVGG